ncbi:MAG TPA: class III poly(R)-hydroxyalkanoic acid synthase subunit PhaC [Nitrospirales bacterium]
MMPFSLLDPHEAARELIDINQKVLKGIENLSRIRAEDIQVGVSPKEEIYREDNLVLYHFTPMVDQPFRVPVLIVYALVNRPYMVDLQEDRSLVRNLLKQGMDVYLIDWGYPARADRFLTLDDYINGYIDNCVDVVRERHGAEGINILSVCQGGTFSLCYTALHPDKVKNLITMVTPVDFHVQEGVPNLWAGCNGGSQTLNIDGLVDAFGNIPGEFMNLGFLMLKPFQLGVGKYVEMIDILDNEEKLRNFLRMEEWIFDSPDQAGEAYRQFMKDFYQGNKLIKKEVKIGGKLVDLSKIKVPVLNVYAEQDHLVPPPSSIALGQYIGSSDYTLKSFPVGHIGMYVSGKVQRDLPPMIVQWLKERG